MHLNIYVFPSMGYSAFELVYLHKSTDLNSIEYSPIQHLSRSLVDYMKIMKKRFDVIKKIFLDDRTHN